jgi:succinate dehydrogenase / fumarate reductase membrane anchor subunit
MAHHPTWRTPRARVRGLGAAGHGAGHWMNERITSVALVPLGLWAVYAVLHLARAGYDGAVDFLQSPVNATLAVLTLAVTFVHMSSGLRVFIEDYIAKTGTKTLLLLLNSGVCLLAAALSIVSVLKVAFSGDA